MDPLLALEAADEDEEGIMGMPRLPSNPKSGVRFRSFDIFISINFGFFVRSSFLLLHCFSETTETFFRTEAVMNFLLIAPRDTSSVVTLRHLSEALPGFCFTLRWMVACKPFCVRRPLACQAGFTSERLSFMWKFREKFIFGKMNHLDLIPIYRVTMQDWAPKKVSILNAVWEMS